MVHLGSERHIFSTALFFKYLGIVVGERTQHSRIREFRK
jgi:hypothetical protein